MDSQIKNFRGEKNDRSKKKWWFRKIDVGINQVYQKNWIFVFWLYKQYLQFAEKNSKICIYILNVDPH